ncbi:unnamed protein product [Spirodela intermedia]|uniref:Uncharacterized protein n=1 Tax=Spirodela intermedia TaxID=51605 RepID=A0A7I8L1Z3_SPIIN|nr:unnamed protein product [Spirodela intermedia]
MGNHLAHPNLKTGDPGFEAWDQKDSRIMAWMWTTMIPEIRRTCLYLSRARAIWENLYQTYSRARDAAQLYELKLKTMTTRQGEKSMTEYTHKVRTLWQEFYQYKIADNTIDFHLT